MKKVPKGTEAQVPNFAGTYRSFRRNDDILKTGYSL
jgi:hypothetical protein